jgi:cytochrome bd-type quinol oxidase subunit 2
MSRTLVRQILVSLALGVVLGNVLVGILALFSRENVPLADVLMFGTLLGVLGGGFASTQMAVMRTAKDKTSQADDHWYKKAWLDDSSRERNDQDRCPAAELAT